MLEKINDNQYVSFPIVKWMIGIFSTCILGLSSYIAVKDANIQKEIESLRQSNEVLRLSNVNCQEQIVKILVEMTEKQTQVIERNTEAFNKISNHRK